MPKKDLKSITIYSLTIGLIIFFLFFLITSTTIGSSVKTHCKSTEAKYGNDCVTALMLQVQDEEASFSDRNHAIWALGQLGDERALDLLKNLYTGEIPPREKWEGVLSQYELKKAIKLLDGGVNLAAWVWR
ncbi:MAG: hypothetical protein PHU71_04520 [Candidatus Gracilibacteria bacterium]|nr:hypothetical protein [Candidatus Gracilibacteria bacterium]